MLSYPLCISYPLRQRHEQTAEWQLYLNSAVCPYPEIFCEEKYDIVILTGILYSSLSSMDNPTNSSSSWVSRFLTPSEMLL